MAKIIDKLLAKGKEYEYGGYGQASRYLEYHKKGGRATFAQWKFGKGFGAMPWESRRQYLNLPPGLASDVQKALKKKERKVK